MGKLSVKEVDSLKESGVLNDKTITEMQDAGLVSTRPRNTARWSITKSNTWVSPQLYFQGINGAEYSDNMNKFKEEFRALINKYCTTKSNKKGNK